MNVKKNESKAISLTVTEGLTVTVLPNSNHEFLMTTKEVANGYSTSTYAVRQSMLRHESELFEGKHFIKGCDIMSNPCEKNVQPHQVLWTKRGIVRLGFFIKSERAKLFRDWAEELILKVDDISSHQQVVTKALPAKRKHNRLTQERLLDIMADVCQIEDKGLRISITNKLLEQPLN